MKTKKRKLVGALVAEYFKGNPKYEGIDWPTKTIIYGDGGFSLDAVMVWIMAAVN